MQINLAQGFFKQSVLQMWQYDTQPLNSSFQKLRKSKQTRKVVLNPTVGASKESSYDHTDGQLLNNFFWDTNPGILAAFKRA